MPALKSQPIRQRVPLREILETLNPDGPNGLFVLYRGYIDESYDNEVFVLSSLMVEGGTCLYLGWEWDKCIERWNEKLFKQNRKTLSRYHAVDCSNLCNEFQGWSVAEQKALTSDLVNVLRPHRMDTMAFGLDLNEFRKLFPESRKLSKKKFFGFVYGLMTKMLVINIGERVCSGRPDASISFIHDRCDYDGIIVDAFNEVIRDPTFEHRDCLTTVASLGWEDCTPLQPADLLAYENFKEAVRILHPRKRRISLEILIDLENFGGGVTFVSRDALLEMRKRGGPSGKTSHLGFRIRLLLLWLRFGFRYRLHRVLKLHRVQAEFRLVAPWLFGFHAGMVSCLDTWVNL